jgi:transglutaminase-like putative cysteine protease
MERDVASHIVLNVSEPADLTFSVAVSGHYTAVEQFTATIDGAPVQFSELHDAHGTRLHRIMSPVGELVVDYSAKVTGEGEIDTATEVDTLIFQRPSRYAQSDELAPTAGAEFAGISDHHELLTAVSSWVGTHLSYVPGSSLPTDGATRTLLARQGVCRDYAHLCVSLLRASGIPARLVSVYAPGLVPMDFHAVAEAWIDGVWRVVDATTLAPRSTLVRIATGRDAADTAWLTVNSGRADVLQITISATVDSLPGDDLDQLVSIA